MTPELEKSLRNDFKKLFEEVEYFDCGDGWEPIIRELSSQIMAVTDKARATGVKQKWGGLRYDVDVVQQDLSQSDYKRLQDTIDVLVKQAEDKADNFCEICGAEAGGYSEGFVQRLCDKHLSLSLTPKQRYQNSLEKIDAMKRARSGDGADWNRLIGDPLIEHRKRAGLPPLSKIVRANENERSEDDMKN
jgi:hypothetical protein